MKRKKELIVILSSLLVIVLSVSVAYFTTKILGTEKDISVTSADLKVIFTNGSGEINGTNIEPGWSSGENTFTVKNESNDTYNYNIVIKDLVNTFTTNGFLVYKITSSDGGYNMTDFADVPKSKTSKDTILAYNISIDKDATHTYTVEFKYLQSTDVDQSADMGKTLSGKIFITKGTERPTLASQLLSDNPTISERTNIVDLNTTFTTNTANTLYKSTENGTDVYYFAGVDYIDAHCEYNNQRIFLERNSSLTKAECLSELTLCNLGNYLEYGATDCSNGTVITITEGKWVESVEKPINNWVRFGKYKTNLIKYRGYYSSTNNFNYKEYSTMEECTSASRYNENCTEVKYYSAGDDIYWRIIRTNADGSIRLLYSGSSPDTTDGYISASEFNNTSSNSPKYAGYMYGDDDSTLDGIRANTNDSDIKTYIDNWYESNLDPYTNYLSKDAVYCNDRELATGNRYSADEGDEFDFKSRERFRTDKAPTYDCPNNKDAFSVNNSEAKLKYPIALMTSDETIFIGGASNSYAPMWYSTNSKYNSITNIEEWWTMTPWYFMGYGDGDYIATVNGELAGKILFGVVLTDSPNYYSYAVRPVTSLKSCVQWKSGDGSASNPYEIVENGGC